MAPTDNDPSSFPGSSVLAGDHEDLKKKASSLLPDKDDLNKQLGKRHRFKDSPPLPKISDSDSPEIAPSESPPPPPPSKPPPSKSLAPLPSPPLPSPPLPSPPPPPQSSPPPPPPSPPPPSPPPPQSHSPPHSPPLPVKPNSSISPLNFNPHKQSPPPPPPPRENSSSSSSHSASSNKSNHQRVHGGGSHAKSRPTSSPGENSGKYIAYTLAGVFIVAIVAVVVVLTFRRKKTRTDVHAPYMHNFHLKQGI